ncbi:MAG TPA: FoF1 ATP synthase subunit a [Candidatus Paceibacterota bacterium]|nr:FoF1 ATP synthase subunit a [Candidatus Paceibacterota bacterium]
MAKPGNTTEGEPEGLVHAITLYAEPVAHVGGFPITNAMVTSWVSVLFLVVVAFVLRAKLKEVPRGIQNVFEVIIDGALGLCDQVTNDRRLSIKIFPVAITVFFFILVNNWLGIMPFGGFGVIENGDHGQLFIPFLRGGTADINTTIALAVMAVVGANIFGVISIGVWKTLNKYVNIKALGQVWTKIRKDPTVIIVAPITFFVGLIEIVGEFAKVASLAFRLFGNVFAGEVLLVSMAALVAYAVPIPFIFMEILVGVVQALIFAILMVVYFTISATDHDHDEEHEAHEEHQPIHEESKIIISNN